MPPKFGVGADKCDVCTRTVYATEKLVLEGKEQRVVLHKLCFRCKHCNKALEVGKYTAADGVYYCEPHYKQLVTGAGSLDDVSASAKSGKKAGVVVTAPHSFVPVEKVSVEKVEKSAADADAPSSASAAAKFKTDVEKCVVCDARVYATERLPIDTAAGIICLHKACLKCADCSTKLEMGAFTLVDGKFYCKRHAKEHAADIAPAKKEGVVVLAPQSFVPVEKVSVEKVEKSGADAESHAAAKFNKVVQSDVEKCVVCDARVYATERLPIDTAAGVICLHKACLKCADCSTKLEMGAFTLLEGKFYCKRHAKDHAAEIAPAKKEGVVVLAPQSFVPIEKVAVEKVEKSHDGVPTKSIKVERDICTICSKAVYATEKLIVSDAFNNQTIHKNCFRCKTCDSKLEMRTMVSVGDGHFYCKAHKPQILRAKGAGDMYAAYGSEYGADAAKSPRDAAQQSTAARLEAEGHTFATTTAAAGASSKNESSDDDGSQGDDDNDAKKKAEAAAAAEAKERDERRAAREKERADEERAAKERAAEAEAANKAESSAAAPAVDEDAERAARRAAREKERADAEAAKSTAGESTDADAERAARRAAREKARADEDAAAAKASEERERKRAERAAAAEAEAKKAEAEAEAAAAARKAKREQREKEAAEEAAKLERELAEKRAKREAARSGGAAKEEAKADDADAAAEGDGDAEDGDEGKGSKVRVRVRKTKSKRDVK